MISDVHFQFLIGSGVGFFFFCRILFTKKNMHQLIRDLYCTPIVFLLCVCASGFWFVHDESISPPFDILMDRHHNHSGDIFLYWLSNLSIRASPARN